MKLKQHEGTPIYPDANSTLRLTYGKVGSYSPKDGVGIQLLHHVERSDGKRGSEQL